ncbi:MAG: rhamnulokinase [Clostridia bacterium]|nr:rhamnulokinase [Clostridia bacterium]
MTYYLAIDIGASSGRHMIAWLDDGKIRMEEIYRFPNGLVRKEDGTMCWDVPTLFGHVVEGIKKAGEMGKRPSYLGIDTWGVDFVLLDKNDRVIGDTVGYRDQRTAGMDEILYRDISEKELYMRTGIQKQIINTIYQLVSIRENHPEQLEQAASLLMIPDYLNFLLTGIKEQEYTDATTGQLIDIRTGDWDRDLLRKIGIPERLFGPLAMPGTKVGPLTEEISAKVGYNLTVMHPAEHDTGSAVLAVPTSRDDVAYLSSGTWSLLGIESLQPICSEASHDANVTNEGGYGMRYRCLKNIMGLWIIQSIKKECGGRYSFDDLCRMAEENADIPLRIDVNDARFLMPDSMLDAIRESLGRKDLDVGQCVAVVYQSLAECYDATLKEIEALTGKPIAALHIIGGGSKDGYLNRLTAEKTGKPVYAGPTEATAIGNILAQMLGTGVFKDLAQARKAVFDSFEVKRV